MQERGDWESGVEEPRLKIIDLIRNLTNNDEAQSRNRNVVRGLVRNKKSSETEEKRGMSRLESRDRNVVKEVVMDKQLTDR